MKIIGYITVTGLQMVYATTINGFVLSKLWKWFMVKTFDLPLLSIPQAIGLSMIVAFLTFNLVKEEKEKDKTYGEKLAIMFLQVTFKSAIYLGIGSIIKLFL